MSSRYNIAAEPAAAGASVQEPTADAGSRCPLHSKGPCFSFGENWRRFLEFVDEGRVRQAEGSLRRSLKLNDLSGRSFLDIGCGSGIFSLAASRLGAGQITSFDADPIAVECCKRLRESAGFPGRWRIRRGSVLDPGFASSLGTFDVVYCWGVLHHTGRMWSALENALCLVGPGGLFHFAIYNKVGGVFGSNFWLRVKRAYNRAHPVAKAFIRASFMASYAVNALIRMKNLPNLLREHETERGMHWKIDATDWIGGYPYEYASSNEVIQFVESHRPEMVLRDLRVPGTLANNSYLYQRGC